MHILIGMIIATVLIVFWAHGNVFACVFLSIVPGLALLIFALQNLPGGTPSPPAIPLISLALLAIIWAPRYLRQTRYR